MLGRHFTFATWRHLGARDLCLFHVTHRAWISFVGHVARQRFSAQAYGGHLALTFDSDILIEFRVKLREILVSHVRVTSWRKMSEGKCNAINDEFFYLGKFCRGNRIFFFFFSFYHVDGTKFRIYVS